jgi:hypothetical protein
LSPRLYDGVHAISSSLKNLQNAKTKNRFHIFAVINKAFQILCLDSGAVANQLFNIRKRDRILVFDTGRIVEDGSHQELLDLNGTYKKLWDSQIGGFIAFDE